MSDPRLMVLDVFPSQVIQSSKDNLRYWVLERGHLRFDPTMYGLVQLRHITITIKMSFHGVTEKAWYFKNQESIMRSDGKQIIYQLIVLRS
jgi:hypothetical protein